MKVILLKEMKKLGEEGTVVEVKNGYARNFLFPQKAALPATKENMNRIEKIRQEKKKIERRTTDRAAELKEKLEALSLTITAQVKDEEDIYGSVGEAQILKALQGEGIESELIHVMLDEPIRKLGAYSVRIQLTPLIEAQVRVWVVKK